MRNESPIITIDLTWLSRLYSDRHDRPTSTWLPRGQRLVGRRFNDAVQPEWMDDAEWEHRDRFPEPAAFAAGTTRLKHILCEGTSLSPEVEHYRPDF